MDDSRYWRRPGRRYFFRTGAPSLSKENRFMIETTGKITEVQKFSETDVQITIEMKVPSAPRRSPETHSHDRIVPAGTAKVGDIVEIAIKEP
jgi:hypothetical protein